jgi:hypothetical protein
VIGQQIPSCFSSVPLKFFLYDHDGNFLTNTKAYCEYSSCRFVGAQQQGKMKNGALLGVIRSGKVEGRLTFRVKRSRLRFCLSHPNSPSFTHIFPRSPFHKHTRYSLHSLIPATLFIPLSPLLSSFPYPRYSLIPATPFIPLSPTRNTSNECNGGYSIVSLDWGERCSGDCC